MAVNPAPLIAIVGCGPGSADYVPPAARQAVRHADVIAGSRRLLAVFDPLPGEQIVIDADVAAVLDRIAAARKAGRKVAVLVSGDPGLHSLAQRIVAQFGPGACEIVPGISSVQVAWARLGLDWADAHLLSAHGRTPDATPEELARANKIAILAGSRDALRWSARMASALEATHAAFLCENLTLDDERVRRVSPDELQQADAASLSIVLLVRQTPPVATRGTLYGIGVGPGDPEWITVKAARVLAACRHVCVPMSQSQNRDRRGPADRAESTSSPDSVALKIARPYLRADAVVHELPFPMTSDEQVLRQAWGQAARDVHAILKQGEDCCFLTLGDALLYSTYIYLLRELKVLDPQAPVVTVPGITAFSAAAAITQFPIGQGKQLVTIVPASDDMTQFTAALDRGGTVVLMKIGRRLQSVLAELQSRGLADHAVFVSHAGMADQNVVTNLQQLQGADDEAGYLSIVIVQAS